MAMNLFVKNLLKSAIGAHVELTIETGAALEKVEGVITDNDYSTSVEITTSDEGSRIIDYTTIKGFRETKKLDEILKTLTKGTRIQFSYGDANEREPNLTGTVGENDTETSIEIITSGGESLILNYSIVRSLLVISSSKPEPEPKKMKDDDEPKRKTAALHLQEPEDFINASDLRLKEVFDCLPREERQKLNSVFDSFKYGIKVSDREKMVTAANQARQILLRTDADGYTWSREAALLCGYLLRRVNIYDPEVFLVGECFEEAAYAAWCQGQYHFAGAYAIIALIEHTELVRDMMIILACGVIKGNDISGIRVFSENLPKGMEEQLKTILNEAFAAKGFQTAVEQDVAASLKLLETLYPENKMGAEAISWLPKKPEGMEETPEESGQPQKTDEPEYSFGTISRINWSDHTGVIIDDDGETFDFKYTDIADAALSQEIQGCLRSDLSGKIYAVKFYAQGQWAKGIRLDSTLVERARVIASDRTCPDRHEKAFALCKRALNTPDIRRALGDMVRYAVHLYKANGSVLYAKEALSHFERNSSMYANNPQALMNVAQCYGYIKKYSLMLEYAEKAVDFPGVEVQQKKQMVSQYLNMIRDYYEISGDKALLSKIIEKAEQFWERYREDFETDRRLVREYEFVILPHKIVAQCGLDLLEEAEKDYSRIPANHSYKATLDEMMEQLRKRMAPKEPEPVVEQTQPVVEAMPEPHEQTDDDMETEEDFDASVHNEDEEEEILPYTDPDGWDALRLTKKEVIDYALSISGEERIAAIVAYLRAGASLNKDIGPVYHAVALAANDPMEAPDYSITALLNTLATSDTDYPTLNDCCMGAAFLRSSFLSGRGYDYSAKGLRDSISICQQLPSLRNAYDTLEQFRNETGHAIDIYADYRNQDVKKLSEDMDNAVRHAQELYTRHILTPPREKSSFARILETKKLLFSKDGYLAVMLQHIAQRDQEALEAEKESFAVRFLNGVDQMSNAHVSVAAIDALVAEAWEQAGRNMQLKKVTASLQGELRNNLRSSVSEIISSIYRWYALAEQDTSLTWRTEQGEAAYLRLRPQLMEQLGEISRDCMAEMESSSEPQLCTGLFLLSATSKELSARLDGSWKFEQERYLYVDFLRSNNIMLTEDFMPELSSTFCALPEFNVLARIRNHVENPKNSFQDQIDLIYGKNKTCNNYGTAERIVAYLEAMGEKESVTLPNNYEQFATQTQMQIEMRLRSFRETIALAMNYGQIIKSDAFCYTLEDTVRYWYAFCREDRNYGFFTSILIQAENQIHASAQQYETQLDEQLDALIASNQQYFDNHSDYAEAIRAQIANQNFTVAEDWMSRIRIGDFSLDVQQPEAIKYLEHFWNSYVETFKQVAEAGRPLSAALRRRNVHNKDTKGAQQLIDNWLRSSSPSNPERIRTLLNLLGWQNINVTQFQLPDEPRGEVYEVRRERGASGMATPQHPIAAYGSNLEKNRMYVVCLYGIYDCDRLFEKMRMMDLIDGSKVFLLDYALGQTDRRELAWKLKRRESGLRNVNIVIDRVLINYLANNYNENLVNRILMATAMPFAYCQPYVVESVHTMPPEIFIGRKDELLKIEQPDGVNLIYGGRQLGKSALFKKALADLDGRQRRRAALIDIKELDCAAAAKKISSKLIDLKITPDAQITEDWDVLCRSIERRLRSEEEEISYFLLMLDEADAFINDCANCGYRPLVALKDIQQSLPGQFKYVLAGLHNIVKFNRQVALGNNSVITHMPSLKITPFRTPEAQELLTVPLSYLGFSLPSKVTVSQILATCNYFPGLIQLYAKKLIESVREADYAGYDIKKTPPYVVSDEHLRRVMADTGFVDQIHEKFEITLTLDQDQGSCYYPLTLLIGWMYNVTPSKNGYTAKEVLYHAKDLTICPLAELDEEKINALLLELQDLNILRSVSSDSFLLASKNFRDLLGSDEEIFEKLMSFGGVTA